MNQEKFLRELEHLLSDISQVEREEAMDYYRCYFEDAGAENEARVLQELGSPKKVADTIKEGLRENSEAGEYTETGYHVGEKKEALADWDPSGKGDMDKTYQKAERRMEKNSRKIRRKVEKNNQKAEKKLQKTNDKVEKKLKKRGKKAEKKQEMADKKARRKEKKAEEQAYESPGGSWRLTLLFLPWLIAAVAVSCGMIAAMVGAAILAAVIVGACILVFIGGFVMLGFAVAALAGGLSLAGMALLALTFLILAAAVLLLMALVLYCKKALPAGIRKLSQTAGRVNKSWNQKEV